MATQSLAQLVKAKYPGIYDDMDDADLDRKVRAKYPGIYDDIPGSTASTRASDRSPSTVEMNVGMGPGAVPIGVDPRPGAAMAGLGMAGGAAALAGPAVVVPALKAAMSPVGSGLIAGVGELARGGSIKSAIGMGVMAGAGAKHGPRVLSAVARRMGIAGRGSTAASAGTGSAAKAAASGNAIESQFGRVLASTKGDAIESLGSTVAAQAAPAVASRGATVAARHNALMQFAKKIAQSNPKVGEKIWLLLDDAGAPVKMLTPDQAGAAARAGKATTWVRNLWAS